MTVQTLGPAATSGVIASSIPIDDRQMAALPTSSQPWPPPEFNPVTYMHRIWDAWWCGDRQKLAWCYYNLGANSPSGRAFFSTTGEAANATPRPGQNRGGLLGSVEYSFWGDPVPPGEKRTRTHVPIAGDIAQTSAAMLFGSPPKFTSTLTGPQAVANQAWLDQLVDDGFHRRLLEAAEMGSALGAVFLRIVWDTAVSAQPWIQPVPADVAVPEFSYDKLTSVTFWRVLEDTGDKVVRHLELHAVAGGPGGRGQIIHGVYEGDQTDLGDVVPMSDYPAMARLYSQLQGNTLDLPDQPLDASTVIYVPNLTPNRVFRDLGPQAWPLGRSDFSGIEPLMDNLDEVFSSWMRDIQLAKMRLIVPPEYLDNIGRGDGAVFEPDRRVFTPLNMLHDDGSTQITANQFAIRWQEHQQTCQDLVNRIVQEAGYSPQSFGDYQGNAPTATEIEARERTSTVTTSKKQLYWRPALQDAIYSLMVVSKLYFGAAAITPERPAVEFGVRALPDQLQLAQTVAALAGAEAASKETLVQMAHPEWDNDRVQAEVKRIFAETGEALAAHARVSLAPPPGSSLQSDIAALAASTPGEDQAEPVPEDGS